MKYKACYIEICSLLIFCSVYEIIIIVLCVCKFIF